MPWKMLGSAALAAVMVTGCSGESGGFGSASGSSGDHSVRFVQQPWGDLVVETEIAIQVLEELGYSASTQEVSVPLAGQALATGDADAYLGNWWPSQKSVFGDYIDTGEIEVVGQILEGTEYSPAVPGYVVEELGVRSFADLDAHADAFGRKIYGIEPGAPANDTIQDAIDEDAYGLGDWQLVASSTEAMLAEVSRRADKGQPVVFLGWSPHWMTIEWDLTFLEDPQDVWPGAGVVRTLTRKRFTEDDPNAARFLAQMEVDAETASYFIKSLDKDGKSAEVVASEWIEDNPDVLEEWLQGVESVDGEPAFEVISAAEPTLAISDRRSPVR
jgi:glycine betaine/proline transport system substrate-binding protein